MAKDAIFTEVDSGTWKFWCCADANCDFNYSGDWDSVAVTAVRHAKFHHGLDIMIPVEKFVEKAREEI